MTLHVPRPHLSPRHVGEVVAYLACLIAFGLLVAAHYLIGAS